MGTTRMNRLGGWRRSLRLPSRVLTVGGTVLGSVLVLVGVADWTSPERRIVLVDTRPIQSVTAPFPYLTDRRRFMRLVVMPMCPGNQEASGAVASSCTMTADGVRVSLRWDLVAGEDGTEVRAADLAQGLERSLKGYAVTAEGNALSIVQRADQPSVPLPLLVSSLRDQPAVVARQGQLAPVGTGPFYVDELWCRAADEYRKVSCSRTGGLPPVRLGELDAWLEDVLVLRRRDLSGRATTEVVVVSLRGKDADVLAVPPRAEALARALARGDVHGVFDIEADLEAELRTASGGNTEGWQFSEPRRDRVLVAALRPSDGEDQNLSSHCRARLVRALERIRQDPTFLRHLGARPANQLLPEPFEPLHTWQNPFGLSGAESSDTCAIELVTNNSWQYAADEIAARIRRLAPELEVKVSAFKPTREAERHEAGKYGVSLLALVYRLRPDAYYLWDILRSTRWATDLHIQAAAELAAKEAEEGDTDQVYSGIEELHRELDSYLIPMGSPTRVVAKSDRLLSLDPGDWYLDPDRLRLAPSASEFLVRSMLMASGALLMTLALSIYISHKASNRRRRLELSLRMLRHDLLAPLSTIRANAERIKALKPKIYEALLSEADAAMAVVEDVLFVVREGRPQAQGGASTRLREEVVEPILESLRRRSSYETGQEPSIRLDLPDEPLSVSMPPDAARFVVRTVVENAWRHRGGRPLILVLAGTVSGASFYMEIKDHGPGVSTEEVEHLFRTDPASDRERGEYHKGSGMGLYLAWSVLHLHGGAIRLRQAADPTIFTIRFPLAPEGRGKTGEPAEKETP